MPTYETCWAKKATVSPAVPRRAGRRGSDAPGSVSMPVVGLVAVTAALVVGVVRVEREPIVLVVLIAFVGFEVVAVCDRDRLRDDDRR